MIVAWVHSHVGKNKYCHHCIDIHTHHSWSKIYPDILGLVLQMDKEGSMKKNEFIGLTKNGKLKLEKCDVDGSRHHIDCDRELIYVSYKKYVQFTDGPLEVSYEYFETDDEDPMAVPIEYKIPSQVIEKFMERGQTIHSKTLAFLAGTKDGNTITVSHIIIPTHQEKQSKNRGTI